MRRLITWYHLTIAINFRVLRFLRKRNNMNSELRILLFHEINGNEKNRFREKLELIDNYYTFSQPDDFIKSSVSDRIDMEKQVLVSFDDGFESNFHVAQEILNPKGIKAVFFVIPAFVEATSREGSEQFVTDYLYPSARKESRIPKHLRSMSWDQIRTLVEQGHIIGSHSMSHRRLSEITELGELEYEIIDSGKAIEKEIDAKVRHFAFPFGNVTDFSKPAADIAIANYEFVFSGIRGSNFRLPHGRILRRETVFPWDPKGFELAVLAGVADKRYKKQLKILDSWCEQSTESNWS